MAIFFAAFSAFRTSGQASHKLLITQPKDETEEDDSVEEPEDYSRSFFHFHFFLLSALQLAILMNRWRARNRNFFQNFKYCRFEYFLLCKSVN